VRPVKPSVRTSFKPREKKILTENKSGLITSQSQNNTGNNSAFTGEKKEILQKKPVSFNNPNKEGLSGKKFSIF